MADELIPEIQVIWRAQAKVRRFPPEHIFGQNNISQDRKNLKQKAFLRESRKTGQKKHPEMGSSFMHEGKTKNRPCRLNDKDGSMGAGRNVEICRRR